MCVCVCVCVCFVYVKLMHKFIFLGIEVNMHNLFNQLNHICDNKASKLYTIIHDIVDIAHFSKSNTRKQN